MGAAAVNEQNAGLVRRTARPLPEQIVDRTAVDIDDAGSFAPFDGRGEPARCGQNIKIPMILANTAAGPSISPNFAALRINPGRGRAGDDGLAVLVRGFQAQIDEMLAVFGADLDHRRR